MITIRGETTSCLTLTEAGFAEKRHVSVPGLDGRVSKAGSVLSLARLLLMDAKGNKEDAEHMADTNCAWLASYGSAVQHAVGGAVMRHSLESF